MRRRKIIIGVTLGVLACVEAWVFLYPPTDHPRPADAIVVFGGPGNRNALAAKLLEENLAPVVVVSIENVHRCTADHPVAEVICLTPVPATTQGEARAFAELARERGWNDLLVVSTATQSVRARLRLERCYEGQAQFVTMREPFFKQMYRVLYENGAMVKALLIEREC